MFLASKKYDIRFSFLSDVDERCIQKVVVLSACISLCSAKDREVTPSTMKVGKRDVGAGLRVDQQTNIVTLTV